jgi:hypothetical protein
MRWSIRARADAASNADVGQALLPLPKVRAPKQRREPAQAFSPLPSPQRSLLGLLPRRERLLTVVHAVDCEKEEDDRFGAGETTESGTTVTSPVFAYGVNYVAPDLQTGGSECTR